MWKSTETGHLYVQILDNVDEDLLAKAFASKPLVSDNSRDTKLCSRIVHPNTGLRQRFCCVYFFFSFLRGATMRHVRLIQRELKAETGNSQFQGPEMNDLNQ